MSTFVREYCGCGFSPPKASSQAYSCQVSHSYWFIFLSSDPPHPQLRYPRNSVNLPFPCPCRPAFDTVLDPTCPVLVVANGSGARNGRPGPSAMAGRVPMVASPNRRCLESRHHRRAVKFPWTWHSADARIWPVPAGAPTVIATQGYKHCLDLLAAHLTSILFLRPCNLGARSFNLGELAMCDSGRDLSNMPL